MIPVQIAGYRRENRQVMKARNEIGISAYSDMIDLITGPTKFRYRDISISKNSTQPFPATNPVPLIWRSDSPSAKVTAFAKL